MCSLRPRTRRAFLALLSFGLSAAAFAGFASTESFLPAVGRVAGKGGAEFYTTVWATNLTGAPAHFTFAFLKGGQANPSPASFTDTLAPGETKVYENVVESKLGLADALGAARVTSDGEILVAERIYDQAPGAALGDTEGLFFAGVPRSFSISAGQSASIQGINQGGSEDFRYNFALVETGGGSADVNVQVFDGSGALLGQKAFSLSPYEQLQPGVADVVANIHTTNARITATVTSGTGSVLLAGAQLANVSQDSSGFEMSFRDDIQGSSGGTAGVTSVNGLTGAVTLAAGSNVTLAKVGQTITIAASGGSAGGGLTLPFNGSASTAAGAFSVKNVGAGPGIYGVSGTPSGSALDGAGVTGDSTDALGVVGLSRKAFGVEGASYELYGVAGFSTGQGDNAGGVLGVSFNGKGIGVSGSSSDFYGVQGASETSFGVYGTSDSNHAISGMSGGGGLAAGVFGQNSSSGVGVHGSTSNANAYAVYGNSNGLGYAGYFDGDVHISGNTYIMGTIVNSVGAVKLDDPSDPEIRYLYHSSVQSPDMKNIYDGVATLGPSGAATIVLPRWFGSLNRDFRYQLTALGTPQAGLFISKEIENNEFTIAGGVPGARVSWMLTGIRRDPWAEAHRIPVEQVKPVNEQGTYLDPAVYGQPEERSLRAAQKKSRAGLAPGPR